MHNALGPLHTVNRTKNSQPVWHHIYFVYNIGIAAIKNVLSYDAQYRKKAFQGKHWTCLLGSLCTSIFAPFIRVDEFQLKIRSSSDKAYISPS